mmetsp:Transcript_13846/g.20543  ORF Transcript_13846/g.20543 Transcript_13846/m.20543 type:complete len:102 (+) Transcript_13846:504-809(+)
MKYNISSLMNSLFKVLPFDVFGGVKGKKNSIGQLPSSISMHREHRMERRIAVHVIAREWHPRIIIVIMLLRAQLTAVSLLDVPGSYMAFSWSAIVRKILLM